MKLVNRLVSLVFRRFIKNPLDEIILVRHGESTGNARIEDPNIIGDCNLNLTKKGYYQAMDAGDLIEYHSFQNSLIYCSPYKRTRETCRYALSAVHCGELRVFEDPRLREVDHGYESVEDQEAIRKIHGWFYYRFKGGESPADCYDRSSAVLESISRQAIRKNIRRAIIFTHGLTIRCIVMRFLHLSVKDFERMANPANCAIVRIARKNKLTNPVFVRGCWGVEGIELRK